MGFMENLETLKRSRDALAAELVLAGATFTRGNVCRCPYHDDKHASAGIFQKGEFWYFKCQTCGVKGDVWDIQKRNTGKDLKELTKNLNREEVKPKIYKTLDELKAACPQPVEDVFFYTHPETKAVELLVIRSAGKFFRQCHPVAGGYVMSAPAKPWPLYNRARLAKAGTVVVVEGERKVHALHEHGIVATTSPGGAKNGQNADWSLLAGKKVILWPDNDDAGKNHMIIVEGILETLNPKPKIFLIIAADIDLPEKGDVVDFINECKILGVDPKKEVQDLLDRAYERGIMSLFAENYEDMISGKLQSVPLPWPIVSNLTVPLLPGNTMTLCGSPGASKSFVLLQCFAYWMENNIKACVFELEQDKMYHMRRALAQKTGIGGLTSPDWVKENPDTTRAIHKEHHDWLYELSTHMWACPDNQPTYAELTTWINKRSDEGYRVICIDPITAAEQSRSPWIDDPRFLFDVRRIARKRGSSVVFVTHPAKTAATADMAMMAGAAANSRFSQTIVWLESHEEKISLVRTPCGTTDMEHNRTFHLLKTGNGPAVQGMRIACRFSGENLTLSTQGVIMKKKKEKL
jgi:hypothetical protein